MVPAHHRVCGIMMLFLTVYLVVSFLLKQEAMTARTPVQHRDG
jgi:hypothetical protein